MIRRAPNLRTLTVAFDAMIEVIEEATPDDDTVGGEPMRCRLPHLRALALRSAKPGRSLELVLQNAPALRQLAVLDMDKQTLLASLVDSTALAGIFLPESETSDSSSNTLPTTTVPLHSELRELHAGIYGSMPSRIEVFPFRQALPPTDAVPLKQLFPRLRRALLPPLEAVVAPLQFF
jgi:hypothetical protein